MKTSLAQVNIGQAFKLQGSKNLANTFDQGIRGFISQTLPNAFIIAGLILLILIIAGGIGMITSAGNPEKKQKNQGVVQNALIGFILVFASYWIIQIIQVITGISILR